MFERRLKVFLGILVAVTVVVALRAAHLQVVNGSRFREEAARSMARVTLVETVRGRILDRKGRVIAEDRPCIDAAVDFRAIERNPKWIQQQALARLGSAYRQEKAKERRKAMLDAEIVRVHEDITSMWRELAEVSGKSLDDIAAIKNAIHFRVDMRTRSLWYKKYAKEVKAEKRKDGGEKPWYREWGIVRSSEPDIDAFETEVAEQEEAHVVLDNVTPEVNNRLRKQSERFPGLVMRPSKHRYYPYRSAASHVVGTLSEVSALDLQHDPNDGDERRAYYPNDQIGRSGVEALCELALRGRRGRIERVVGREEPVSVAGAERGRDVKLTIDIELQMQIEEAFRWVQWRNPKDGSIEEEHEMHGAAVVIDVPTGEVLALVSAPTYDLNLHEELFPKLAKDEYNKPLLNRATYAQYEPGSTVKTIVGAAGVTQGLIGINDKIECTGYLIVNGRPMLTKGRCWTASKFGASNPDLVAHHKLPWQDPHPDGKLTLADAIQRSCNIYFQEVGFKLGIEGLAYWYGQFGLGRKTGIGLPEVSGRLPKFTQGIQAEVQGVTGYSSIGQGQVLATPLQIANVAATFARDGEWVRPTIVASKQDVSPATTRPAIPAGPDRVKIPLSREALSAVKEGMHRVVNTRAGSAYGVRPEGFVLAGKTGTAQTPPFSVVQRDESGNVVLDENRRPVRIQPPISLRDKPNKELPWYRGSGSDYKQLHHAWFIGYAPADNPKVAFAVMLEYGGSGGGDAAPITKAVLDALEEHRYIPRQSVQSSEVASGR